MTTKHLGIIVPESLHKAAHATARLHGKNLTDWLTPLIEEHLHPATVEPLFLAGDAQQKEQNQSNGKSSAA